MATRRRLPRCSTGHSRRGTSFGVRPASLLRCDPPCGGKPLSNLELGGVACSRCRPRTGAGAPRVGSSAAPAAGLPDGRSGRKLPDYFQHEDFLEASQRVARAQARATGAEFISAATRLPSVACSVSGLTGTDSVVIRRRQEYCRHQILRQITAEVSQHRLWLPAGFARVGVYPPRPLLASRYSQASGRVSTYSSPPRRAAQDENETSFYTSTRRCNGMPALPRAWACSPTQPAAARPNAQMTP